MAIITLDIPPSKMNTFMEMIFNIGLDKSAILSSKKIKENNRYNASRSKPEKKFLLFDWEFFNNELEFE